jgi:hypothetical protein
LIVNNGDFLDTYDTTLHKKKNVACETSLKVRMSGVHVSQGFVSEDLDPTPESILCISKHTEIFL